MASRFLLVVLLLTLPVATVALPPDPLWTAGLYDGADYDDCLAVFDSPSAGVTAPIRVDLAPPRPTGERVFPIAIGGPSSHVALPTAPRSPPSV